MTYLNSKSLPSTPLNIKSNPQDYFSLKPILSLNLRTNSKLQNNPSDSEDDDEEEESEFDETRTDNIHDIIDKFDQVSIMNHHDENNNLIHHQENDEVYFSPITPFDPLDSEEIPKNKLASMKNLSRTSSPQLTTPSSPSNTTSTNFKLSLPNLSPLNLLIVDDNIINLKILNRILLKLYPKSNITQIKDSTLVPNLLNLNTYDSIFIDIEMPIINGLDLAKLIRDNKKFNKTSLIAVTTRNSFQDLQTFQNLGIDYTFNKPLNYKLEFMSNIIDNLMKFRKNNDIININNYFSNSGTSSTRNSISSCCSTIQSDLMSNISSTTSNSNTCSCPTK
ncbi:SRR1 [Candida jiufengensis]|uniref:SRR1 n=1 Tax=Candida jiufengensis TaxID=497108 RepID=UPI002224FBCC|nr:SRR1 [Candida jiufengensis]KAI5954435.1 SRR1 [Candida jiufengensis]